MSCGAKNRERKAMACVHGAGSLEHKRRHLVHDHDCSSEDECAHGAASFDRPSLDACSFDYEEESMDPVQPFLARHRWGVLCSYIGIYRCRNTPIPTRGSCLFYIMTKCP